MKRLVTQALKLLQPSAMNAGLQPLKYLADRSLDAVLQ